MCLACPCLRLEVSFGLGGVGSWLDCSPTMEPISFCLKKTEISFVCFHTLAKSLRMNVAFNVVESEVQQLAIILNVVTKNSDVTLLNFVKTCIQKAQLTK